MTTRSAGRATVTPREGRTGGRIGRGGGRTRGRSGDQGNGRIDGQGGQIGGQGNEVNDGVDGGNPRNQNGNAINDKIQGNVRNVIVNNNQMGCTYKEFLVCNPKEYDGKGGVIVYTRLIEKMESVQDMSGCEENQKVKYTTSLFVDKALTWWNFLIHTRSREAVVGMLWEDFKTLTREEFRPVNKMQKLKTELWNHAMVGAIHVAYTDRFHELARSLKKNLDKRGNCGEPNRDRNARDKNKRTRNGNAFATTTNPMRREYNDTIPKCVSCNLHHPPEMPCRACFNYGCPGHIAKDCRVALRMVNPVNARNPTAAPGACYECGGTDNFKAA
nr:reverse transcriptase domain-containing protein [Tanacetum cinerariifolium]